MADRCQTMSWTPSARGRMIRAARPPSQRAAQEGVGRDGTNGEWMIGLGADAVAAELAAT
jgi:hypothetical protein